MLISSRWLALRRWVTCCDLRGVCDLQCLMYEMRCVVLTGLSQEVAARTAMSCLRTSLRQYTVLGGVCDVSRPGVCVQTFHCTSSTAQSSNLIVPVLCLVLLTLGFDGCLV